MRQRGQRGGLCRGSYLSRDQAYRDKRSSNRKSFERAKDPDERQPDAELGKFHSRMSKLAKDELTYGRHMSLEDLLFISIVSIRAGF